MGKLKLEKGKKAPVVAVEAPKDRVKTKSKQNNAKKVKEPKMAPPVEKETAASDSDEAPEAIPIAKVDQVPTVSKNKNKKKKNKKGTENKEETSGGDLLKINKSGKVGKPPKQDAMVDKIERISKKLKSASKNLKTKEPEVEDPAEEPEFLATKDAIRTAVIALRKATEEESKEKKKLFDKDFKYCMQLCSTKIPKVPTRLVRMVLPHSLYDDTDDVCLVVRDEMRGKQHDPDLTAAKYEQIFREQKIDFVKKVMPFQEMKQNFSSFEQKRKLGQTYDVFLCDSIISARVFQFTGKCFIQTRKSAVPVNIKHKEETELKAELQKALHKTCYKQVSHGMTTAIEVATHKHSVEQFTENIEAVLEKLRTEYPGGWVNIKNIYLKPMANSVVSLPLYISEIDPNRVPVPVIVGPKYRHLMKMAARLDNESKKFKMQEGFKLEKKKGKRSAEEASGDAKKVKKEADDSGVQSEEDVKEEEEASSEVKSPKKQKKKKNKKGPKPTGEEETTEQQPKQKKAKLEKPKEEVVSPKKVQSMDKKPKFDKKANKKGKKAKA